MSTREAAQKAMRHRVLIVDDEESMRLVLARILVTALRAEVTLADAATQNRCMKSGATGYLVKPVERNSLVATVKAQMAGRGKPKSNGKGEHA